MKPLELFSMIRMPSLSREQNLCIILYNVVVSSLAVSRNLAYCSNYTVKLIAFKSTERITFYSF